MTESSRLAPAVALALLLGGCAGEPEAPAALPPSAAMVAPPVMAPIFTWEGGVWVVTDVFGGSSTAATRFIGLRLRLDKDEAGDLTGRTCSIPTYRQVGSTEAAFLDHPERVAEFPALDHPVSVVEVQCDQQAFGRYARWKDGSLLAMQDGLAFRLAKWDSAAPTGHLAVQPEPSEMTVHPAAPSPSVPPPPAPKPEEKATSRLVYLASYRDEATALHGWDILKQQAPQMEQLTPVMTKVELGSRGTFLRLQAKGLNEADAKKLCAQLASELPDCGAKGRD